MLAGYMLVRPVQHGALQIDTTSGKPGMAPANFLDATKAAYQVAAVTAAENVGSPRADAAASLDVAAKAALAWCWLLVGAGVAVGLALLAGRSTRCEGSSGHQTVCFFAAAAAAAAHYHNAAGCSAARSRARIPPAALVGRGHAASAPQGIVCSGPMATDSPSPTRDVHATRQHTHRLPPGSSGPPSRALVPAPLEPRRPAAGDPTRRRSASRLGLGRIAGNATAGRLVWVCSGQRVRPLSEPRVCRSNEDCSKV
jgi:hypothetical protein